MVGLTFYQYIYIYICCYYYYHYVYIYVYTYIVFVWLLEVNHQNVVFTIKNMDVSLKTCGFNHKNYGFNLSITNRTLW